MSLEEQLREEDIPLKSETIGAYLGATGDSIRKDLSHLTQSKDRSHYDQRDLQTEIKESLKIPNDVPICLVGLGNMGQQVIQWLNHWHSINLKVLFDTKINRMERLDLEIPSYPAWEIPEYLQGSGIKTAILATDPEEAEKNAERLLAGGIKSILNLSGYYLVSPQYGIRIRNLNILTELLILNTLI